MATENKKMKVTNAKITTIYKVVRVKYDEQLLPTFDLQKGEWYYTEEGFKKYFHSGRKLLYCQVSPKYAESITTDELCEKMVTNANHGYVTFFAVDDSENPIVKLMDCFEPIDYYAVVGITVNN